MLAVAAVLTACTNEDNFTNEQLPNTGNEAHTYTVNIPASMGEGAQTRAVTFDNDATPPTATGSFAATEPVYVYNETKGVMLSGELHPTDISADGKSCNLTGDLTGTFDAGDQLTLLYNMIYNTDPAECFFDYGGQDGSESGVVDGGMATGVSATISGSTLTTATTVTFAMQQAIFRMKFTDGTNTINVKSLIIKCTGSDVASCYNPFNNEPYIYSEQSIVVMPNTPTSDYLYVALCINESASPSTLTFTVTDDDCNVYTATKAAPSSGFKNGKYYYSSAATVLTWQTKLVKPTITWTSVADIMEKEPDEFNLYQVFGPLNGEDWGPSEFTISGTSRGYRFFAVNGATIHLDNLDAIMNDENDFIHSSNDQCELIIDVNGANNITCKKEYQAISSEGTLKFMGNGTLTVTANNSELYGLYAETNYKDGNNSDPSVLAAPGYAVTRSATTDNGDGTYTWTYTVTPAINGKFSVSDTKQVYFSKGNLQATTTDHGANWTWAFAAHQWDYVGNAAANTSMKTDGTGTVTANGTVDLFGWVGASSSWTSAAKWGISASKTSDDYGNVDNEALKSDWGNVPGIGSGWRTLTKAEWEYLFNERTVKGGTGNGHSYTLGKTVNSIKGVVIYPDNYTGAAYAGSDWNNFEAAGCVFLPAGGNRNGTLITSVDLGGYYWTSTSSEEDDEYMVSYTMSTVNTSTSKDFRYKGQSVRLVRDAN